MGATTATSAIIVAHELIHHRRRRFGLLGRMLLWTTFYDHFYVEHLRGHHVRIATGRDEAAARADEPFWRFAWRSLPGELASAWRLSPTQTAVGVAIEAVLLVLLGPRLLAQAAVAAVLITANNYLQHWGLGRHARRQSAADAWDCDSALSHYALLGVSRHADHHLHAGRPYPALRPSPASPQLPHGYFRMVVLVLLRPRHARRLLAAALRGEKFGSCAGMSYTHPHGT
jgi:alkane 1-monooxygenase